MRTAWPTHRSPPTSASLLPMTVAAFEGVAQTAGSKAQPASSFFVILERTLVGSPAVSSCGVHGGIGASPAPTFLSTCDCVGGPRPGEAGVAHLCCQPAVPIHVALSEDVGDGVSHFLPSRLKRKAWSAAVNSVWSSPFPSVSKHMSAFVAASFIAWRSVAAGRPSGDLA